MKRLAFQPKTGVIRWLHKSVEYDVTIMYQFLYARYHYFLGKKYAEVLSLTLE